MTVNISLGNSKLGRVANISLIPGKSCIPNAPCKRECYAMKAWKQYPNVRKAWTQNWKAYQAKPIKYFADIAVWLGKKKPKRFRWHVAGDIQDQSYLNFMKAIAVRRPETQFLAFTKQYGLDYAHLPDNLQIVLSAWPGHDIPDTDLPIAWMQDGTETRIPKDAVECNGKCDQCGECWELRETGKHVWFKKH